MLHNIREVKMLGLSHPMKSLVNNRRSLELKASKAFRKAWALRAVLGKAFVSRSIRISLPNGNGSRIPKAMFYSDGYIAAHTPHSFIWLATLGGYVMAERHQDTKRTFGVLEMVIVLSKVNLLIMPLGVVLNTTAQAIAAIGCFRRIQDFLDVGEFTTELQQKCHENQMDTSTFSSAESSSHIISAKGSKLYEWEKATAIAAGESSFLTRSESLIKPHVGLYRVSVGWSHTGALVRSCTFTVDDETPFTIISGPTGSGKSTLLRAIVGEAPIIGGQITTNTTGFAFCDQVPWLWNGTIRNVVLGSSVYEDSWFGTVMSACALDVDISQMPDGYMTVVGSSGKNLSGGQKQRIVSNELNQWMNSLIMTASVGPSLQTIVGFHHSTFSGLSYRLCSATFPNCRSLHGRHQIRQEPLPSTFDPLTKRGSNKACTGYGTSTIFTKKGYDI